MLKGFRDFLIKDNAFALAIGIIIGGAFGKFVTSITDDLIMPIVGIFMPAGTEWQKWGITLVREGNIMKIGNFIAAIVNLIIIGLICYILTKALIREKAKA